MVGPIASVVFKEVLNETHREWILSRISEISSSVDNEEFWVNNTRPIGGSYFGYDRPFIFNFGFEYPEEQAEITANLKNVYLFNPVDKISIAALSNSPEDHRILAEICKIIAERFKGLIDFGGNINEYTEDSEMLETYGCFHSAESNDYLLPYYMEEWLAHPNVTMVK